MPGGLLRASPEEYHHATADNNQYNSTQTTIQSTYVLNDVAMVTDEEEGTAIRHIDLHTDQP